MQLKHVRSMRGEEKGAVPLTEFPGREKGAAMKGRTVLRDGPDPIDVYVGSRVRARRVGMRLSQTKLGQAIGVTCQQVQKYENGANRIGASNLYKIACTLGVEVSHFYEGMPDFEQPGPAKKGLEDNPKAFFENDPMASREAIELVHNYFRVPDEQVRKRTSQFLKPVARSGKALA